MSLISGFKYSLRSQFRILLSITTMSTKAGGRKLNDGDPKKYLDHVQKNAIKGDLTNVINTIDNYCWNEEWHMNVGDVKGKILDGFVEEQAPKFALELGSYLGYSGLRIASKLGAGAKLFTIEKNPDSAEIAKTVYQYAGVQDKVTLLQGDSNEVIQSIKEKHGVEAFDFVFIDHWKNVYKRDVIALENAGLLRKGTMLVADNCIHPGCPEYLEYVRNSPKYKSESFLSKLEYCERDDALEKSIYLGA